MFFEIFVCVIVILMDQVDFLNEGYDRLGVLVVLVVVLVREGFELFYVQDKKCYLCYVVINIIVIVLVNFYWLFLVVELKWREQLIVYFDLVFEDELIEEVFFLLFWQLGFYCIIVVGYKDKVFEYGKDVWMKYVLLIQYVLYFGI